MKKDYFRKFKEQDFVRAYEDELKSLGTSAPYVSRDDVILRALHSGKGRYYISFEEADISNVAVKKNFRRKNVAENMLNKLFYECGEKGVSDITLEVRETNVPAISLYEKLGFEEAGIRKNFYEKPVENALIMWKHD